MTWKEIKSWCKQHQYIANKMDSGYTWASESNPEVIFTSKSVSKLARDVYNHMTSGIYLEHQASFVKEIKHEQPYN